jgi:hypothetical protein
MKNNFNYIQNYLYLYHILNSNDQLTRFCFNNFARVISYEGLLETAGVHVIAKDFDSCATGLGTPFGPNGFNLWVDKFKVLP